MGASSAFAFSIYNKMNQSPQSTPRLKKKAGLMENLPVKAQLGPWVTPSQVKLGEINRGISLSIQF